MDYKDLNPKQRYHRGHRIFNAAGYLCIGLWIFAMFYPFWAWMIVHIIV